MSVRAAKESRQSYSSRWTEQLPTTVLEQMKSKNRSRVDPLKMLWFLLPPTDPKISTKLFVEGWKREFISLSPTRKVVISSSRSI